MGGAGSINVEVRYFPALNVKKVGSYFPTLYKKNMKGVITINTMKSEETDIIVKTSMLANLFGVTTRTINKWERDGCPKESYGKWSLKQVIAWHDEYIQGKTVEDDVNDMGLKDQKTYFEVQLKKAQSESRELRNAIERGDYLEKNYIQQELARFFTVFKRSSYAMGKKIIADLQPKVTPESLRGIDELVSKDIKYILEQFATKGMFNEH